MSETTERPKAIDGKITDEDIARQRAQIAVSQHTFGHHFNHQVTADGIRHFAFGMVGDDNPLWNDAEHGPTTRWRTQIAPPLFYLATGLCETPAPSTPEMKALFRGLYRGVGRYNVGTRWQFFKPLRHGDQIYHDQCVDDVQVKDRSSFSGARTVLERFRHLYVNQNGEPVAVRYESFVNAERSGSKEVSKHADLKRHVYSKEDIEDIDRKYAAEECRGANARFWEDVAIGDEIVPVVKGPLGLIEVIGAHLGWGLGSAYGVGPLRLGWKTRQKLKNFFSEDRYGVPGSMMRVHWDQERAEDLGLPAPYDYAQMRSNWLAHAITNWMGDEAWIQDLHTEARMFNFHGDTTFITGKVTGTRTEGPHHLVDLALQATNQRQEVTTLASACVALPSRTHGPVILPQPDLTLLEAGVKMMADSAQRIRDKRSNAG